MNKPAIIAIVVVILLLVIPDMPVMARDYESTAKGEQTITLSASSDNNTSPQTWNLHSKAVSGGYIMDQAISSANKGEVNLVTITGGASTLWISDQAFLNDTQYSGGVWHILIFSLSDWGINEGKNDGSLCRVEVGTWNGTNFKPFTLSSLGTIYSLPSIRKTLAQKTAGIVYAIEYLAIQVSNADSNSHAVYTAETGSGSYVSGLIGGTITNLSVHNTATTSTALSTTTAVPVPTTSKSSPSITTAPASTPSATALPAPVMPVPAVPTPASLTPVMPVPGESTAIPSINKSTVPAASARNNPSNTKTPPESAASNNQSSLLMAILGVGLAIVITIGIFMAVIIINKIIVKRRNRKTQAIK